MKNIREVLDLKHKKYLRLGVLLLSTLLITSASALVYYSIANRTVATTAAAGVKFIAGGDCTGAFGASPCGVTISAAGTYAALSTKSYPNATVTYQRALNVSNTDATTHTIRLRSIAISGGSTSYSAATSKIEFDLINVLGVNQGSLIYTGGATWSTPTSTAFVTIAASPTSWTIQVIAIADSTAATGVATTIDIGVDVQ